MIPEKGKKVQKAEKNNLEQPKYKRNTKKEKKDLSFFKLNAWKRGKQYRKGKKGEIPQER